MASKELDELHKALDKIPSYVVSLEVLYAGATGPSRREHPEDQKMREEGERYGAKHAAEFVDAHRSLIDRLIGTYPDSAAHEALDSLRETFWANEWNPTPLAGDTKEGSNG